MALALGAATLSAMNCPKSAATFGGCGMRITTTAPAACSDVLEEMTARVDGQFGTWHDPHNNGTYTKQSYGGTFSTSRRTGDNKYTDKQIFTLTDAGSGCTIEACSRSQVTSYYDYGTNYCDLKMLYCGSEAGCKPVKHDFSVGTETTKAFYESSVDLASCLKVAAQAVAQTPVVEAQRA